MTKFNLLCFFMSAMIAVPMLSMAQPKMGKWADDPAATTPRHNFYIDYVGGRVVLTAPANLAGPVTYTISNDGVGTDWGKSIRGLSSPILDVSIVKADPYDACGPLTNPTAISGKIALIKRGTCEFGTKAFNAQKAGAVAVIIVNHSPGAPVLMGKGANGDSVQIPVIMVSDVDGAAIESAIAGAGAKMSMAAWSNGYNRDLGFVDRGLSLSHAYSIPLNQIKGSTSNILKGFDGAVIGNFGTNISTSTKLKVVVKWTPDGGSTSVVHTDSSILGSFAPGDSIITPFIDRPYSFNPTTTGRYDVEYEITPSFTDDFPGDNKASYSFYVDNRIYSKGRYDFATGKPVSGTATRTAAAGAFLWGNLMYMEKADYAFEAVKLVLSNNDTSTNSMANKGTVDIAIWKWEDQNGDSVVIAEECTLVGLGTKTFTASDTSAQVHDIAIKDPDNSSKLAVTQANTMYWVTASVPDGLFMYYDGNKNYFVRSWARSHSTAAPTREPSSPLILGDYATFYNANSSGNPRTDIPSHFPFERFYALEDSIRFSQQKSGYVPALPVQMSLFTVGVNNVKKESNFDISIFPNPASDKLNVSLQLDKEAKDVRYAVLNAVGARVTEETHHNVTKDSYSLSTAQLASGTYYLIINIDGNSEMRKFSVIK